MSPLQRLAFWHLMAAFCIMLAATQLASADYPHQFWPIRTRLIQALPLGAYQPPPLLFHPASYNGPLYRLPPHRRFLPPPTPFLQPFPSYEPLGPNNSVSPSFSSSSSATPSSGVVSPSRTAPSSTGSAAEAQANPVNRTPLTSTNLRSVVRRPATRRPQSVARVRPTASTAPPVVSSTTQQAAPTSAGALGPSVVNDADIGFDIPAASNSDSSSLAGPLFASPISRGGRSAASNIAPPSAPSSQDGFSS